MTDRPRPPAVGLVLSFPRRKSSASSVAVSVEWNHLDYPGGNSSTTHLKTPPPRHIVWAPCSATIAGVSSNVPHMALVFGLVGKLRQKKRIYVKDALVPASGEEGARKRCDRVAKCVMSCSQGGSLMVVVVWGFNDRQV